MADINRIKRDIAELATRPKGVRFSEIERIINQLGLAGYRTSISPFKHGKVFNVGARRFTVTEHNPGSSHVKACYVRNFLNEMAELGLYGDENE